MKRSVCLLTTVAAALALVCVLVGCGTSSPSQVVTKALDAFKAGNFVEAAQYYGGQDLAIGESVLDLLNSDDADGASSGNALEESAATEEAYEAILAKILDFDYVVDDECIGGDKATVSVTMNAYNLTTPVSEALADYFTAAISAAFSEAFGGDAADEQELIDDFARNITSNLTQQTEKSVSTNVTFNLTRENGTWTIDTLGEDVLDGATGGLYSMLDKAADALAEYAD